MSSPAGSARNHEVHYEVSGTSDYPVTSLHLKSPGPDAKNATGTAYIEFRIGGAATESAEQQKEFLTNQLLNQGLFTKTGPGNRIEKEVEIVSPTQARLLITGVSPTKGLMQVAASLAGGSMTRESADTIIRSEMERTRLTAQESGLVNIHTMKTTSRETGEYFSAALHYAGSKIDHIKKAPAVSKPLTGLASGVMTKVEFAYHTPAEEYAGLRERLERLPSRPQVKMVHEVNKRTMETSASLPEVLAAIKSENMLPGFILDGVTPSPLKAADGTHAGRIASQPRGAFKG